MIQAMILVTSFSQIWMGSNIEDKCGQRFDTLIVVG